MIKQYRYISANKNKNIGQLYETEYLTSNTYIHLDYIHTLDKLESLFAVSSIDGNIDDFKSFAKDLVAFQ